MARHTIVNHRRCCQDMPAGSLLSPVSRCGRAAACRVDLVVVFLGPMSWPRAWKGLTPEKTKRQRVEKEAAAEEEDRQRRRNKKKGGPAELEAAAEEEDRQGGSDA
ncbi:hypothetical protein Tsubulata_006401, partial [Turnera subulata]